MGVADRGVLVLNQPTTGNVLTNDSDAEGAALAVTQFVWNSVTTAAGGTATISGVGTLTIAANGAYTFTPATNFGGPAPPVTYTLSDGSLTSTATLVFLPVGRQMVYNSNFSINNFGWTGTGLEFASNGTFGAPTSPTGGSIVELEGTQQGSPGNTNAISQIIATRPGEAYFFSTDAITRSGNTGDRISFIADGTTLSTVTTTSAWANYVTSFTATAPTTTIRLQSAGSVSGTFAGADDGRGGLVDNVQVQELNNTPAGPLAANEDVTASYTGSVFSIASNATGTLTVTLTGTKGTLSLNSLTGLTFTVGDGSFDPTMTFSGTASAINNALASLRYRGDANFNGTGTITQTVTSGSLTDTDTVTVNVASVNDAPTGTARTVSTLQDGAYTFSAADFAFTDANDSPADALKGVVITNLPTQGTLTLGGGAVTAGQTVLAADLGSLVWRPADASGAVTASFTFRVVDDGGTANGGIDTDPTARTFTWQPTLSSNLVVNGGFTSGATNWTGTGIEVSSNVSAYGITASPTGGNFVELEGLQIGTPGMTNAISQVIATTAGENYIFSTDGITRAGGSTGDRISFITDGSTLSTVTTTRAWSSYSTSFTAAAATTTIRLQSAGSVSGGASPGRTTGEAGSSTMFRCRSSTSRRPAPWRPWRTRRRSSRASPSPATRRAISRSPSAPPTAPSRSTGQPG